MSRDRVDRPTGQTAARIIGASRILRSRAASALAAAQALPDQDSPFAASLRGKAAAYTEAAELLERLDKGHHLNNRVDRIRRRAEGA